MKSPFPGMDPYLEAHWRDVHQSLCTYARDALQPQVLPAMRARLEERLVVMTDESPVDRMIYPDVKVVEHDSWRESGGGGGGGTATIVAEEPIIVQFEYSDLTEPYVEILDPRGGGRVITVVEFLCPANKLPGQGRAEYLRKQRQYHAARVSLVEIDLVRRGPYTSLTPLDRIPKALRTPCMVSVHRCWKEFETEVYPLPLRKRLPAIRIPLRASDADAVLDLQALVEQTYRNGAYDDIDYSVPPEPPLDPEDAAWAADLLKSRRTPLS